MIPDKVLNQHIAILGKTGSLRTMGLLDYPSTTTAVASPLLFLNGSKGAAV